MITDLKEIRSQVDASDLALIGKFGISRDLPRSDRPCKLPRSLS